MSKRTSPLDAHKVDYAKDIDELVTDKRKAWRANSAKARRRQRRYKKLLTNELLLGAKANMGDE